MLYWWVHSNILCSPCDNLTSSFLIIARSCLWSVISWLCGKNSNEGIFLGHAVCLELLFQCCCTRFQCWSGFFFQLLLARVLHCWVLYLLGITFHPLILEDLLWDPDPTCLFLGTSVLLHYTVLALLFKSELLHAVRLVMLAHMRVLTVQCAMIILTKDQSWHIS